MQLLQWLPVDLWIRAPLSVVVLIVVLVAVIDWLPARLKHAYGNWRDLVTRDDRPPRHTPNKAQATLMPRDVAFPDRRSGRDRRSGPDRRQRQILIPVERRSGRDRRRGDGRPIAPAGSVAA